MSTQNATQQSPSHCYAPKAPEEGPPLFQHGDVVFQAHHVGWIITGFFTVVATVTSLWLVNKHLQWYTNKLEQRYIIRILFMVPIYSVISLASYLFWDQGTPLLLIRDAYESTVLTSFFYLLLMYLSSNSDEQKAIFLQVGLSRTQRRQSGKSKRRRNVSPELQPDPGHLTNTDATGGGRSSRSKSKKVSENGPKQITRWNWPLGWLRWKPKDGVHFLWLMKWGVLQYCVIRPTTTLIAVILDYQGLYCDASLNPRWGHVWVLVIISISVTIAMYCLIQLYMPVSWHLAKHRPLLKLFAIKAVVFLTFWQATFLSLLAVMKVVKDTRYMTAGEINIGFGALLETFEMMIIGFFHITAFSYKPYRPPPYSKPPPKRTPRWSSFGHAMDFRETWREIVAGVIWIWDWAHHRERRVDRTLWRDVHLERALGRSRLGPKAGPTSSPSDVTKERTPDLVWPAAGHGAGSHDKVMAWLGDGYGYQPLAPNHPQWLRHGPLRGMSDDLEEEVEKVLRQKGYNIDITHRAIELQDRSADDNDQHARGPRRAWRRGVYSRLSQSFDHGHDPHSLFDLPDHLPDGYAPQSSHHPALSLDNDPLILQHGRYSYDDPPPVSIIQTYQNDRVRREEDMAFSTNASDGHQQPTPGLPLREKWSSHVQHAGIDQPASMQTRNAHPGALMRTIIPEAPSPATDILERLNDVPSVPDGGIQAQDGQVSSTRVGESNLGSQGDSSRQRRKRTRADEAPMSAAMPSDSTKPSRRSLHRRESAFVQTHGSSPGHASILRSNSRSLPITPGQVRPSRNPPNGRPAQRRESVHVSPHSASIAGSGWRSSPRNGEPVVMQNINATAGDASAYPRLYSSHPDIASRTPLQQTSGNSISALNSHLPSSGRTNSRALIAPTLTPAAEPISILPRQSITLHTNPQVAVALPRLPTGVHLRGNDAEGAR